MPLGLGEGTPLTLPPVRRTVPDDPLPPLGGVPRIDPLSAPSIHVTYGLIPQIGKTSVVDDAAQTEPGDHRRPFGGHGPSRGHHPPCAMDLSVGST